MQGKAHNVSFSSNKSFLFTSTKSSLPKWFQLQKWQTDIKLVKTQFLNPDIGIRDLELNNFKIRISSVERAILEALYLVPKTQDFQECYYLMEGLMDMRPKTIQVLLEECKSVKVKRLFLFMAKKAKLPLLRKLDSSRIDLGSGKRMITLGGKLDLEYQITYPREFEVNE